MYIRHACMQPFSGCEPPRSTLPFPPLRWLVVVETRPWPGEPAVLCARGVAFLGHLPLAPAAAHFEEELDETHQDRDSEPQAAGQAS
jgi:hypothetical protein